MHKSLIKFLVKVILVIALLWWMIDSQRLDFSKVWVLVSDSHIFTFNILLWIFGTLILTSLRWQILLRGMKLFISAPHVMILNAIGLFFNSVMPGGVGGDLIKAYYVFKAQEDKRKTPAMLSILLDRIIGLYGILTLSFIGLLTHIEEVWQWQQLQTLAIFLLLSFFMMTSFFLLVLSPWQAAHQKIDDLLNHKVKIKALNSIYSALKLYQDTPSCIVAAWIITTVYQGFYMAFYYVVTLSFGHHVEIGLFATILPFGLIAVSLPLSPGGLGVGHAAFEKLFTLIGLSDGANVFNIIFIGQMSLNLLGVIPYLLAKNNYSLTANKSESEHPVKAR